MVDLYIIIFQKKMLFECFEKINKIYLKYFQFLLKKELNKKEIILKNLFNKRMINKE